MADTHTVAVVTLGCPKNVVMSEQMIYRLEKAGYKIVAAYSEAEIIVLNTCAFKDSSEDPLAFYVTLLTAILVVVIAVPVTQKRCEPVVFIRDLVSFPA